MVAEQSTPARKNWMPASGIKLADANVWLALAFSDHQHHARAAAWFENQPDRSCAFCRITQLALLRHLTNGKIMGKFVQTQQQAWSAFDRFLSDPRCIFLEEPAAIEAVFRSFTSAASSSLERWTDAYLAALAIVTQSQFVTFDKGFDRFHGVDYVLLS